MSLSKFVDRIVLGDCVEGMRQLPDACVPLTLTSPPYDGLRDYGGPRWDFDVFRAVASQLWRITMPGGVVVWVVADAIEGGSETCTSSRQKLHFREVGFNVYHTMIMARCGTRWPCRYRYGDSIEYALILSKGKPRAINLLRDRPNRRGGQVDSTLRRELAGRERPTFAGGPRPISHWGVRKAIWTYATGGRSSEAYKRGHPAPMPEAMARDHILTWSRPGDLVLDPFAGSGTTTKLAILTNRRYLGFEAKDEFHEMSLRRAAEAQDQVRRLIDDWLAFSD
jgi:DNA modification methylase